MLKNRRCNTSLGRQSTLVGVFVADSCTAGFTYDRIIVEYTLEEYCDVGLILGVCESRTGTDVGGILLHYSWSAFSRR